MSLIAEKLTKMKAFKSRTAATNKQITGAEIELGLKFAKEYKEYLVEFGCASVFGHEFTGICNSTRLNVVNVTTEQKSRNTNVPFDWYVIEETNIDDIIIWQDSKGNVYATISLGTPLKIANSFLEYISN